MVNNNSITFTCNETKPTIDLNIALCSTSSEMLYSVRNILGKTDISDVGDGTLTGAIKYIASRTSDIVVELPTTGWVEKSDGTYTFSCKRSGVLKTDYPLYGLVAASSKPSSEELTSFGCIQSVRVVEGTIIVTSSNPLPTSIKIVVKGCAIVNTSDNSSFMIVNTDYEIESSSWVLNSESSLYEAEIMNPVIQDNHIVNINFKGSSVDVVYNAGILDYNDSYNGKVVLYAENKPSSKVVCDYTICGTGSGVPGTYGIIGDTTSLSTNDKSSVINAINELNDKMSNNMGIGDYSVGDPVIQPDENGKYKDTTLATESGVMDAISKLTGALSTLKTEEKTNIVGAINELVDKIDSLLERL